MPHGSDEQQIREVIATWMRATAAGDVETVLSLMANDVVFLTCGNPPMRGRKAFAVALQKALQHGRIIGKSAVMEITVVGNYAFCWNFLTVTMKPKQGGRGLKRKGHVLSVFHKERNGRWVIFRDANLLDA